MVWRGHFQRFLRAHRELSAEQAAVIDDAIALASDEAFTPPLAPDVKERISALFNQSMAVLGPKQTDELFVTLGPKTLQRANGNRASTAPRRSHRVRDSAASRSAIPARKAASCSGSARPKSWMVRSRRPMTPGSAV